MLIMNMGIPRSGTTWAFNVFRSVLDNKKQQYTVSNPSGWKNVDAALASAPLDSNHIMHFHDVTNSVIQKALIPECFSFFNIRDPRDVVVSQMHLHDADFETAINMTMAAFGSLQRASVIPGIMLIPFEHIRSHPEALIYQMAFRIGHYISPTEATEIATLTSSEKHTDLMNHVLKKSGEPTSGINNVYSGQRKVSYDEKSLITDRHIQSGNTGRWKDELSSDQQIIVNETFTRILQNLGLNS